MFSRLFQTKKVICHAAMLALFLQGGSVGCAFGCARASVELRPESHIATTDNARDHRAADAAFSAQHACCHTKAGEKHEAFSAELIKTFHRQAEKMQCCLSAGQQAVPALKQRVAADSTPALERENVSILH